MWSDMESGILEMVLLLLNLADVACVASVCREWRCIVKLFATDRRLTIRHRSWLVMSGRPYEQAIALMNPLHRPTSPLSQIFCGAFGDWLVINDMIDGAYLYHPLLHNRDRLPPLTTPPINLTNNGFYLSAGVSRKYVRKVLLSSPPSSPAECLVAIIFGPKGMAFCRLRDSSWTQLDGETFYDDAVFHNGRLVAVDHKQFVWSFGFGSGQVERQLLFQPTADWIVHDLGSRFLVESVGQLLMVIQKREINLVRDGTHRRMHCATYGFEIFQLDADGREWTRLETLGKRVMILTQSLSAVVAADEIEKDFGSDCIYYSEYKDLDPAHWAFFMGDKRKVQVGTFLEDGTKWVWGNRAPLFFYMGLFSVAV